jgi:hypothetical protein
MVKLKRPYLEPLLIRKTVKYYCSVSLHYVQLTALNACDVFVQVSH